MSTLFESLGGRKNTLVLFALGSITLMTALGHLPVDQFIESLTWLLAIGVGGHALVGAAGKLGDKKKK